MSRVIAVTNQKGGVGKTTTSVNLAASLVAMGRRILLLDMDPQGNATMGSGVDKTGIEASVFDLLVDDDTIDDLRITTDPAGYDLIPSNADLIAADIGLLNLDRRESRLRSKLEPVRDRYDLVIIDCPPSLSLLTINALTAADSVLIPMQCEYYALEGLSSLLETIRRISDHTGDLEIEGLLRTMYDPRNSLTIDVSRQLIEHFADKVFRTVIPRNVRLAEAPSHGIPVLHYDRHSRGARAYLALAAEIIRRQVQ